MAEGSGGSSYRFSSMWDPGTPELYPESRPEEKQGICHQNHALSPHGLLPKLELTPHCCDELGVPRVSCPAGARSMHRPWDGAGRGLGSNEKDKGETYL